MENLGSSSIEKAERELLEYNIDSIKDIKRCSKCILLETYPYISFDKNGVCNYCLRYNQQKFLGEESLLKILDKHRSKSNEPDCIA